MVLRIGATADPMQILSLRRHLSGSGSLALSAPRCTSGSCRGPLVLGSEENFDSFFRTSVTVGRSVNLLEFYLVLRFVEPQGDTYLRGMEFTWGQRSQRLLAGEFRYVFAVYNACILSCYRHVSIAVASGNDCAVWAYIKPYFLAFRPFSHHIFWRNKNILWLADLFSQIRWAAAESSVKPKRFRGTMGCTSLRFVLSREKLPWSLLMRRQCLVRCYKLKPWLKVRLRARWVSCTQFLYK